MNYIQKAREILAGEIDAGETLLDYYTLLVLTKGENVTMSDVHDAWSIWMNQHRPQHEAIIPFDGLPENVQEFQREYADAIRETARKLAIDK